MASLAYSYILSIFKNPYYHSLDSLEAEEMTTADDFMLWYDRLYVKK